MSFRGLLIESESELQGCSLPEHYVRRIRDFATPQGEGMSSVKGMIGNVGDKFRMVLQDKANNKTIMAVVGGAVLLFFLWYFLHGR